MDPFHFDLQRPWGCFPSEKLQSASRHSGCIISLPVHHCHKSRVIIAEGRKWVNVSGGTSLYAYRMSGREHRGEEENAHYPPDEDFRTRTAEMKKYAFVYTVSGEFYKSGNS
jgi:hypothetical protein